jgi:hypothetical protein
MGDVRMLISLLHCRVLRSPRLLIKLSEAIPRCSSVSDIKYELERFRFLYGFDSAKANNERRKSFFYFLSQTNIVDSVENFFIFRV